MLPAQEPTIEH